MTAFMINALFALLLCVEIPGARTEGFLMETHKKGALRSRVEAGAFQAEVRNAMNEALGCGGQVSREHLESLEQELLPMWRALPKNALGRVERRSLRYLAYRHFNKKSALSLRGFEPSRVQNSTSWGNVDILSQRVPAFVESVLESQHAQQSGFDLHDAAYMVAVLEQLIFDSESGLLETVYEEQRKPKSGLLSVHGLDQVLEAYLIHWMMGDDQEGIEVLLGNKTLLSSAFPHWDQLTAFAKGQIRSYQFLRQQEPVKAKVLSRGNAGGNALSTRFSFDDAHAIVGGITRSFASFWESECITMKKALFDMDTHHTGRVPLSRFYSSALESDWRFGESEAYLRELGALDETSWRGKQVIIPNYILAASNCIVSTHHYMVCCMNDCESITSEIEAAIGAPVASPDELLAVVRNISSISVGSLDDERFPELGRTLYSQLETIAAAHNGQVPLHGRLFAQWLHYAFPRECPFPHKLGTAAAATTPTEYGSSYVASDEEMKAYASTANTSVVPATVAKEELQWMSQWSEDEELIMDYAGVLRAPWQRSAYMTVGSVLLVLASLAGVVGWSRKSASNEMLLPTHGKAHFV